MSAKMECDATFIIVGRGMVLAGWITDGIVKIGMLVSVPSFPRKLRIIGIEMINVPALLPGIVGLLVPFGNEDEISLWKNLAVAGQIVNIMDAEESPP